MKFHFVKTSMSFAIVSVVVSQGLVQSAAIVEQLDVLKYLSSR